MLLVQQYLETHTFGELAKEHGVYASFSKSGHKFSLNYDQIEAQESDPLAQECRGLVLSLEDGRPVFGIQGPDGKLNRDSIEPGKTRILAYPMKRFFNHGQGAAASINWNDPNLSVLEKLDGTLCIVYYDPFTAQWCVATRSVPEADLIIDMGHYTFRTLFEKAVMDTLGYSFEVFTRGLVNEMTYCFELTTPYNRIVVQYNECRITLLAARYLPTLRECNPAELAIVQVGKIPHVHTYAYTSVDDILNWVSNQNPLEHEGVVVRDAQYNRIKVKNAAYVAFNRARDVLSASDRNVLDLILQEKDDDVIPMLPPEIVENLRKIKEGVQNLVKEYDAIYHTVVAAASEIKPGDKKTFAITLTQRKELWSAPFFQIYDGKASNMKDYIQKNRGKDGHWSNSFLDRILDLIKS
jgi:hypothetical protein